MQYYTDYWFDKFDSESFEKDFLKVLYKNYIIIVTTDPLFNQLQEEYNYSEHKIEHGLQSTILKILNYLLEFFDQDCNIHSKNKEWANFCQNITLYVDVEKLYSLIFWKIDFINTFILKRIFSFFLRFSKLCTSLQMNIFNTSGQSSKAQKIDIYNSSIQENRDYLNCNLKEIKVLISNLAEEISKSLNLFQKRTMENEKKLLEKIAYCLEKKQFFEKSVTELKRECDQKYGRIENILVEDILKSNEQAIKDIDYHLDHNEINIQQQYDKDLDQYNKSTAIQDILKENAYKLPNYINESKQKLKIKIKQNKKKNKPAGKSMGTEQRDFTTQQTQETQTTELLDEIEDENVTESQLINQFNSDSKKQEKQKQHEVRYQDLDRFKNSPNNPLNQKNQGLQEIMNDAIQNVDQEMKGKSKKSIPESKEKMKQGGENQAEIIQALHKNADKPQTQNINKNSDEIEEESSEQASQDSSEELNRKITDKLYEYIQNLNVNEIAIKEEDINFNQQQLNIRLKKGGEENYQQTSKDNNEDQLSKQNSLQDQGQFDSKKKNQKDFDKRQIKIKPDIRKDLIIGKDDQLEAINNVNEDNGQEVKDVDIFEQSIDESDNEEQDEKSGGDGSLNNTSMLSSKSDTQSQTKVKLPFTPHPNNQDHSFISYLDKTFSSIQQQEKESKRSKQQLYQEGSILSVIMKNNNLIPYKVNHWTLIQDFVICIKTNKSAVNKVEQRYENKAIRNQKSFKKKIYAQPNIQHKNYCSEEFQKQAGDSMWIQQDIVIDDQQVNNQGRLLSKDFQTGNKRNVGPHQSELLLLQQQQQIQQAQLQQSQQQSPQMQSQIYQQFPQLNNAQTTKKK